MKEPPIQHGALYPGTYLRQRYQAGKEICPEYQGPEQLAGQRFDTAVSQLVSTGHRAFYDAFDNATHACFSGQWCRLGMQEKARKR